MANELNGYTAIATNLDHAERLEQAFLKMLGQRPYWPGNPELDAAYASKNEAWATARADWTDHASRIIADARAA